MVKPWVLVPLFALFAVASPARAETRDLLWGVTQACVLNHSLTGAAFPCLAVETAHGVDRGFAVVRAPKDKTRIVIVPTVRTPGIEAKRLRGSGAPNYFQDAWASRRFVSGELAMQPSRGDLAMAVNSQGGRSQDQLHIHVACVRADVKRRVLEQRQRIRTDRWAPISVRPSAPSYAARWFERDDLSGINLFDQAAQGLKVDPDDMDGVTIVVLATEADARRGAGFIVMTRKKRTEADQPHGEGLLDPACTPFRGSRV